MINYILFRLCIVFFFFIAFTAVASAEAHYVYPSESIQAAVPKAILASNESTWAQTNGPAGGIINTIEIDPAHPEILYAGGAGGGVFKTTDGGTTWTMLEQIVDPSVHIRDILISPDDPQTMYAQTDLIYKSTDGGMSWSLFDFFGRVTCLSMSRENPSVLVAGTGEGKAHYSADGGGSWTDISGNLPGDRIADIAIGVSNEFWAGTANGADGHLYHTTNGGVYWDGVDIGQRAATDIHTIFVDPDDLSTVYVGLVDVHNEMCDSENDNYLLKTQDGGTTWTPIHLPGTDAMINVMGRTPTDDTLYVGTGGTVYKSSDGGQDWTWIGPPGRNGDMYDIAVDPCNSDVLYLPRQAYGIVKSADGGASWTPINQGLLNVGISLMAVPSVPGSGTVYAASVGGEGTFKTTDWGNSWTYVNEGGITHPWADELVVSPHDPETVLEVADVAEVFQTTDGGTTWSKIINPYGDGFRFGSVSALSTAPSDPDTIYAVKDGFGIFKSTDGGESWQFLHQSEVDYTYSIAVHSTNPDIVYSGYNPKPFQDWSMVRKTIDGGDSWQTILNVSNSTGITSVVIDPNNPNTVYAGSTGENGGAIYKSTDGGNSWSKLNEHFTMCTVWGQPQLIVDPNNPSIAYAATWLAGTWKTADAGETWTLLEEAPVSSTALSLNTLNSDVIYLADRSTPTVWKTTDAGSTWEQVADFSGEGALIVIRVLANGDTIYAATFHPNLEDGKLYKSTNACSTWNDITDALPKGVLDVVVDPTNSDIVYVTTNFNGAYKSTDGGANWTQMLNFPDVGAYDIEVDPVDPTILYTSARGGSCPAWFTAQCHGKSGLRKVRGSSLPAWFTEIAGDELNGIIFTDAAGVYKSTNSGSTWSQILTTTASCRAIRQHPDDRNMLFAVDLVDGLQVSTNGGNSWTSYNTGLNTAVLTSCAVGGDKIYVGTQGCGVYSGDINMSSGSITWQPARSNKPVPKVHSLQIEVDPTNSNRIFVGANPGGLFRSDVDGTTFRDKNGITPSVVVDDPFRQGYYTFAINPSDASEMWLGTWGKGIYKSYNAMGLDVGAQGTDMKMYGKHIYQIVIDPDPPNAVYVATEEGIFKSSDGGATWSDFSTGLGTPQIQTLVMTADGTLLCGTLGYELYYYDTSDDRWVQMNAFGNFGTFWPIWDDRPLYQYTSLLFHPTDPDVIYFGTFPSGIYKSTDGGQSWRESNVGWTNDGVFSLVFHPKNTDIIYAGTYNGVSRSTDGGAHWEMWDEGWPDEQWVFSIDFDPREPNVMYACSKNGENEGTGRDGFHGTVMKSTDGGATWFSITTGLNVNQEFYKIIVDKLDPDTLYLATQFEGVSISRDHGALWLPWSDGLTNPVAGTNGNNVANPMVQSADGRYLYFGSAGSSVFRRPTVTNTYPHISVNLNTYDFGSVDVGSTSTAQSFIISNTGTVDLVLGILSIEGPDASEFSIQNDNCTGHTISPLETCTIEVVFSPTSVGAKRANLSIPSNDPDTPTLDVSLAGISIKLEFDTGSPPNPYPSIMGNHTGTIKPNHTVTASKLYTYPCVGTGGHTEYARIGNETWNATATWEGYVGDWHNITFDKTVVLLANKIYNYTIHTGSYPQIIHESAFNATGGEITCTKFTDANGKVYYDWIPAIRLWA